MNKANRVERDKPEKKYRAACIRFTVPKPPKSCGVKDCFHCRLPDCDKNY